MSQHKDAGNILVGIGAFGVLYWIAYALALAVVATYVGLVIAIGLIAGCLVLGLINYARYMRQAIDTHNAAWAFDLVAAPLLGTGASIALFGVLSRFIHSWIHFLAHTSCGNGGSASSSSNFGGPLVSLFFGVIGIILVVGSPYVALTCMGDGHDRRQRLWAYGGFMISGAYWGVVILAWLRHVPIKGTTC